MGIMKWFQPRGIVVTVVKGKIGPKKDSSYLLMFTDDKGIVKVNKRMYYFLGVSEQSMSEMSTAKTLSGAAIGTIFAPGLGTLIGGAIGAKKKKKTNYTFAFMDVETSEKFMIEANLFATNPKELERLEAHPIANEQTLSGEKAQSSTADEIREFKKLLDEGVISEEEFNEKKKQLLS
ncbi:SHOCT domain-containing protein [Alkalihalobacillus trypoxylicola]|uniref:SHOCT domain-containing protein n=1 Tax=Alkalihalobacillus trypoxylicola TaxID=519424 RepID=A0A161PAB7_9BACI|nr:SHOCT domain-containing protein [Alkalihalobacillus trypoxylicola]KYG28181.1 hypothetical protein AZF04_09775 [Alkalihalobacillus trypoxylicola]